MERRFKNKETGKVISTNHFAISSGIVFKSYAESPNYEEVFPVAYLYDGNIYYKKYDYCSLYIQKGTDFPMLPLKKLKDATPYWNESDIPKEERPFDATMKHIDEHDRHVLSTLNVLASSSPTYESVISQYNKLGWYEKEMVKKAISDKSPTINHLSAILQLEVQYLTELIQKMPERIMKEMKNRE